MTSKRILRIGAALPFLAAAMLLLSTTQASADSYNYSNWSTGRITFGPSGGTWTTAVYPNTSTYPHRSRVGLCQNFGFYNCQVSATGNTWVRAAARCRNSAYSTTIAYGPWSQTLSTAVCPSNYPYYYGTTWSRVASISYSNYSY